MPDSPGSIDIDLVIARVQQRVRERRGTNDPIIEPARIPPGVWTHDLQFGLQGNAAGHQRSGFSAPEDQLTWTDSAVAEIELPPPPAGMDIWLSADLVPHTCREVPVQHVRLLLDRRLIGVWSAGRLGTHHAVIFAHNFPRHRAAVLRLELPDAFSPQSRGLSEDARALGVAFRKLVLRGVKHS